MTRVPNDRGLADEPGAWLTPSAEALERSDLPAAMRLLSVDV
jgi:hypothetical protein